MGLSFIILVKRVSDRIHNYEKEGQLKSNHSDDDSFDLEKIMPVDRPINPSFKRIRLSDDDIDNRKEPNGAKNINGSTFNGQEVQRPNKIRKNPSSARPVTSVHPEVLNLDIKAPEKIKEKS
jgi:hypothetical protein